MDVSVSVLGLIGLIVENNHRSFKSPKRGRGAKNFHNVGNSSFTSSMTSNATISSWGSSDDRDPFMTESPVTAIASLSNKRNSDSNTGIPTHLPSFPLKLRETSTLSINKHNCMVKWPITDFDSMGNALSTYKCDRLRRRNSIPNDQIFNSEGGVGGVLSSTSLYVPEELHVTLSLMRASEVITIGTADIFITGQEENNSYLKVPIHTTVNKNNDNLSSVGNKRSPMRLFKKGGRGKQRRSIIFLSDSKRTYSLEKTAYLKVLIKVSPTRHSQKKQLIPTQWNKNHHTKMSTGVSMIDTDFDYDNPCPANLIRQTRLDRNPMLVKAYREINQRRNYEYDPPKESNSLLPWFSKNSNITKVVDSSNDSDFHHQLNSRTQAQIKSSRRRVGRGPIKSTGANIMSIGLRPPNNFDSTIDNIPRHLSIMETASSDYDISLMSMSQLSRTHEEMSKSDRSRIFYHEDESTMIGVSPCDQLGFLSNTKNFFQCRPMTFPTFSP